MGGDCRAGGFQSGFCRAEGSDILLREPPGAERSSASCAKLREVSALAELETAMGFKTILVPIDQHGLMNSTLETALVLARSFDSYIEGFALRVAVPAVLAIGEVGALPPALEHEIAEHEKRSRNLFESFMQEHGVPRRADTAALSSGWFENAPEGDDFVGSY